MTTTTLLPEISAIETAWRKHVLTIKPERQANDETDARDYLYAGSHRACRRRMVLEATHPSYFPDVDIDAKARFIRGEQREVDLRQALERAGQLAMPSFTVEGQQERVMLKDRKGRRAISGKKDCSIRWQSGERWSVEFKSWSVFLTDKIDTFADLLRSPWTQGGAFQLLSYLYAKDEPVGLLVLDRPGLPLLIPVRLEEHIGLMEEFLTDAEICIDHIKAETLPDYIDNPEECRRCPVFGSHCNPPVSYDGASIITDAEVIAMLEQREALKAAGQEYKALDEALKERFREIPLAIAGQFTITGKPRKVTKLVCPDEIKRQYQVSELSGWSTTIVKENT